MNVDSKVSLNWLSHPKGASASSTLSDYEAHSVNQPRAFLTQLFLTSDPKGM
jgi:hypothetical protein